MILSQTITFIVTFITSQFDFTIIITLAFLLDSLDRVPRRETEKNNSSNYYEENIPHLRFISHLKRLSFIF